MVNVTLCFSANQALLAAKAGATFISPFIGRLDDIGLDGMDLIREIRTIYDNYPRLRDRDPRRLDPHRAPRQAGGADRRRRRDRPAGASCRALVEHPLTDKGLEMFLADWKKTGQRIV